MPSTERVGAWPKAMMACTKRVAQHRNAKPLPMMATLYERFLLPSASKWDGKMSSTRPTWSMAAAPTAANAVATATTAIEGSHDSSISEVARSWAARL